MRFKSALLILLFYLSQNISAQQKLPIFDQTCSYEGEIKETDLYGFTSDNEAEQALKRIMRYTGLPANFEIMAANVPNAAAVIKGDQRYILYNQYFMEQIKDVTNTNWASISILAHEIGHHLSGHTLDNLGSRPDKELETDRFSGFVLFKMGASLEDARAVMNEIGGAGSATHPSKSARLSAITNGWISARDLNEGIEPIKMEEPRIEVEPSPSTPVSTPKVEAPAADHEDVTTFHDHFILSSAHFPNISSGWNKGYYYKDAVNYMNRWYAIMATDDDIQNQSWRKKESFPGEEITERWDNDYRISNVDYFENEWVVVLDERDHAPAQRWKTRTEFPKEDIASDREEGFMVVDVTYNPNDQLWAVVTSKGDWSNQTWWTRADWADLKDKIKEYWDKDYYITTLKYAHDRWVLVMTKYNTDPNISQRWNSSASFLKDKIGSNEDEGFILKELTYGKGLWISVMNKHN